MVEGGPWRNFDEIEDALILDELLLLVDAMTKKQKNHFRMLAAVQGVEVPDDDEHEDMGDDDLPEELLAEEREYQKKKQEKLNRSPIFNDLGLGIGYEGSPIIPDQLGI